MNRSLFSKPLLWAAAALLCAVILCATLFAREQGFRSELKEKNTLLSESRDTWDAVAQENEKLLEELDGLNDQIREAEKSLEEAATRREKLETQIAELSAEIEALQQNIP